MNPDRHARSRPTHSPHRRAPAAARRSPARRLRRFAGTVASVGLVLGLLVGPAAANGGGVWPVSGAQGMRNHQPAATGPITDPGLEWRREPADLDGWTVSGATVGTAGDKGDLALSLGGDLLGTATRVVVEGGEDVQQGAVISLDAGTGNLQWAATGMDDSCRPAVAANGNIWALQVLDDGTREAGDAALATRALVALDPADGSLVAGVRYTEGDGLALRPSGRSCGEYGLQLAADGAVLIVDNSGFDPTVRAVNPDGTSRWAEAFPRPCVVQPWVYAPSSDAENADRVYLAIRGTSEDCPFAGPTIVALNVSTGDVVDDLALPGSAFGDRLAQAVHEDGDLLVSLYGPGSGDGIHLVLVSATGALVIGWQVDINDGPSVNDPVCAAALCNRIRDMAVAGDRILAREGNGIASIDATDGSLQWRDTITATGPLIVDGQGNAYTGRLSGTGGVRIAVLSPAGTEIATVDGAGGLTGPRALGPIGADGTLFGRDGTPGWFAITSGAPPLAECIGAVAPDAGFTDVVPNSTHDASIDCVVFYGLAQGTSATTYAPSRSVSREQMASFIARLIDASDQSLPAAGNAFGDVSGVHANNVERLAAAGIVQGRQPGTFDPKSPVSRDQMASFLVRAFEFVVDREAADADVAFTDIAGNTHEANIRRVFGLGFTTGQTTTTYAPSDPVRRDQMASFLKRALENLVEVEGRIPVPPRD